MSLLHPHNGERHGLLDRPGTADAPGLIGSLDPRSRVLASLAVALLVVALRHPASLVMSAIFVTFLAVLARLPLLPTLRRLLALDGFMVLALAMLPFTIPGETMVSIAGLEASWAGGERALIILLKANAVVLAVFALLGTLEPVALGHALARLGVAEKLVNLLLFTVRYMNVLHLEYRRLRTAMRARAFAMHTDWHTWRSLGYLFGMLMVRSVERSERIVAAMRCRGFDGRFPALEEPTRFRVPDGVFALTDLSFAYEVGRPVALDRGRLAAEM